MSSAKQNIERAKGAAAERKAILAEVRAILKLYGGKDAVLLVLVDKLKDRERIAKMRGEA